MFDHLSIDQAKELDERRTAIDDLLPEGTYQVKFEKVRYFAPQAKKSGEGMTNPTISIQFRIEGKVNKDGNFIVNSKTNKPVFANRPGFYRCTITTAALWALQDFLLYHTGEVISVEELVLKLKSFGNTNQLEGWLTSLVNPAKSHILWAGIEEKDGFKPQQKLRFNS